MPTGNIKLEKAGESAGTWIIVLAAVTAGIAVLLLVAVRRCWRKERQRRLHPRPGAGRIGQRGVHVDGSVDLYGRYGREGSMLASSTSSASVSALAIGQPVVVAEGVPVHTNHDATMAPGDVSAGQSVASTTGAPSYSGSSGVMSGVVIPGYRVPYQGPPPPPPPEGAPTGALDGRPVDAAAERPHPLRRAPSLPPGSQIGPQSAAVVLGTTSLQLHNI